MEEVMRKSKLLLWIVSALLAGSLSAWAAGPNRLTNRAACKRWTSGLAQDNCISCVKQGKNYFRKTGECR
jgi:hypothetical protein